MKQIHSSIDVSFFNELPQKLRPLAIYHQADSAGIPCGGFNYLLKIFNVFDGIE